MLTKHIRKFDEKAGDPGSNPGRGGNFSLKLTTMNLPDGYSIS